MMLRNAWPLSSGELAVRPGLRAVAESPGSGFLSVHRVGEYLLGADEDGSVYLGNGDALGPTFWTEHPWGLGAGLRETSVAVVQNQVVVASPGRTPLFGVLGGDLEPMTLPSRGVIRGLTPISPPSDFVCEWAGRVVAGDSRSVIVSDPLLPRAYTAQNEIIPPGGHPIHRAHQTSSGALAIVTSDAVWMMDRSAAASGARVAGALERVVSFRSRGYHSTAVCRGRLWGLTEDGVKLIDAPDGPEIRLREKHFFARVRPRVDTPLADQRLYSDGDHLWVSGPGGACCRIDTDRGLFSWWFCKHDLNGAVHTQLGLPGLLLNGALAQVDGDTDDSTTDDDDSTYGGVVVSLQPERHVVGRAVHVMSDRRRTYVNTRESTGAVKTSPALTPILGTSAWASTTTAEAELVSSRHDVVQRTDEQTFEIGAVGQLSRFALESDPEMTTISPERP